MSFASCTEYPAFCSAHATLKNHVWPVHCFLYSSCDSAEPKSSYKAQIFVCLQDLTEIKADLEPKGALHSLQDSAPGFSKASIMLDALVQQNAIFQTNMVPVVAPSAASVAAQSQPQDEAAAASSFSQQLELAIKSMLLWAQALQRPAAASQQAVDEDEISGELSQKMMLPDLCA